MNELPQITWRLRVRLLIQNPANIGLAIFIFALVVAFAVETDFAIVATAGVAYLGWGLLLMMLFANYCEACRIYLRTWKAQNRHYERHMTPFDAKRWMRRFSEPCPRTGARLAIRDYKKLRLQECDESRT